MRCKSFVRLAALLLIGTPPVLLAFQAAPPASSQVQQQQHPLDPLTATEIDAVAGALRASSQFPADGLFSMLTLKEPLKTAVLAFAPGASISRQAFAVILDSKGQPDVRGGRRSPRSPHCSRTVRASSPSSWKPNTNAGARREGRHALAGGDAEAWLHDFDEVSSRLTGPSVRSPAV